MRTIQGSHTFNGKETPIFTSWPGDPAWDFDYGGYAFGIAYDLLGDDGRSRKVYAEKFKILAFHAGYKHMIPNAPEEEDYKWSIGEDELSLTARYARLLARTREYPLAYVAAEVAAQAVEKTYKYDEGREDILEARAEVQGYANQLLPWFLGRIEEPKEKGLDEKIAAAVTLLSSELVEDRQKGQRTLEDLGRPVAWALKPALNDATPEVRARVTALFTKWAFEDAVPLLIEE